MREHLLRRILSLIVMLAPCVSVAASSWNEVRTSHFEILSEGSEAETDAVAQRLESVLDFYRQLFYANSTEEVPIRVRVGVVKTHDDVAALTAQRPGQA